MGNRAIPEKFEADVLRLAAEGQSVREVAAWLSQHGVKASKNAVAGLLKARRAERSEVAKTVVREKLAATLTPDLDIIGKWVDILDRKATALAKSTNPKVMFVLLQTVEQLRKMIDMRMHYAGADQPDDSLAALAEADRLLMGELDRIASRARA